MAYMKDATGRRFDDFAVVGNSGVSIERQTEVVRLAEIPGSHAIIWSTDGLKFYVGGVSHLTGRWYRAPRLGALCGTAFEQEIRRQLVPGRERGRGLAHNRAHGRDEERRQQLPDREVRVLASDLDVGRPGQLHRGQSWPDDPAAGALPRRHR